jgi:glucosamine 6-phosphate synthetase-like amidotransferase/phosphosugar isomerase protein
MSELGMNMECEIYAVNSAIADLAAHPPQRIEARSLLLIAHGSSLNACQMVLGLMRERQVAVRACVPQGAKPSDGERIVAVSQSGRTLDVLALASAHPRSLLITNGEGPDGMQAAAIHAGVELAVCATKTVVNTVMALDLATARSDAEQVERIEIWLARARRLHGEIKQLHDLARSLAAPVVAARAIWVVAEGDQLGVAHEIALKLQEGSGRLASAMPATGGLHGPVVAISADDVVLSLGEIEAHVRAAYRERCAVRAISSGEADMLQSLMTGQLLALECARLLDCDPDAPPGLNKVTNP